MGVTNYIWDVENDSYLMETNENGDTVAEYTNEPGQYGPLVSQRRSEATSTYHFDAQHSTRQLTDEGETITDTATYTAFGQHVADTECMVGPFAYVGALGYYLDNMAANVFVRARTYDPKTSLVYVRNRFYSNEFARWMSADPVYPTPKSFEYCRSNPINLVDPSGLRPEDHHWLPLLRPSYRGRRAVRELCIARGVPLNIDDYTMTLENSRRGTPHHWLHNGLGYRWYLNAADQIYTSAIDCCDLMSRFTNLIFWSYGELLKQQQLNAWSPPVPSLAGLMHPHRGSGNTLPRWFDLLHRACECRPEQELPRFIPYSIPAPISILPLPGDRPSPITTGIPIEMPGQLPGPRPGLPIADTPPFRPIVPSGPPTFLPVERPADPPWFPIPSFPIPIWRPTAPPAPATAPSPSTIPIRPGVRPAFPPSGAVRPAAGFWLPIPYLPGTPMDPNFVPGSPA